jgi:hypothetical protein
LQAVAVSLRAVGLLISHVEVRKLLVAEQSQYLVGNRLKVPAEVYQLYQVTADHAQAPLAVLCPSNLVRQQHLEVGKLQLPLLPPQQHGLGKSTCKLAEGAAARVAASVPVAVMRPALAWAGA